MKTIILLSLMLLTSCASIYEAKIKEIAQKRVLQSVVELQMNKDGIFQKCMGFYIKPNKLLTSHHCLPSDLTLSYIQRKEIALFDRVESVNLDFDYMILKTKKDNAKESDFLPKEGHHIARYYLIPQISDNKMHFIKCLKIIDDKSFLNKLSCDRKIIKSMSGSPILNDQYEFTGVLTGFLQKDAQIAIYTLL